MFYKNGTYCYTVGGMPVGNGVVEKFTLNYSSNGDSTGRITVRNQHGNIIYDRESTETYITVPDVPKNSTVSFSVTSDLYKVVTELSGNTALSGFSSAVDYGSSGSIGTASAVVVGDATMRAATGDKKFRVSGDMLTVDGHNNPFPHVSTTNALLPFHVTSISGYVPDRYLASAKYGYYMTGSADDIFSPVNASALGWAAHFTGSYYVSGTATNGNYLIKTTASANFTRYGSGTTAGKFSSTSSASTTGKNTRIYTFHGIYGNIIPTASVSSFPLNSNSAMGIVFKASGGGYNRGISTCDYTANWYATGYAP